MIRNLQRSQSQIPGKSVYMPPYIKTQAWSFRK